MEKTDKKYGTYVQILKEELVPAMGCTEPIAIAYAAAKAREILGTLPDKVEIGVSGNIIKNVKSVVVPNTDGLKGIQAAAAAGIVGGKSEKQLEVIAEVTPEQKQAMKEFLKNVPIQVEAVDNADLRHYREAPEREPFLSGTDRPVPYQHRADPEGRGNGL